MKANEFRRTGYSFDKWRDAQDETKTYANGQSVVNLVDESGVNVLLNALWQANTYTVRFNSNGGTSGTMTPQSFTYDIYQPLKPNAYGRTGYSYQGWATSSGGSVSYSDGQNVANLASMDGAMVDLYAVWSPNTYKVTLDNQSATSAGTPAVWYKYNTHDGNTYYYTNSACT